MHPNRQPIRTDRIRQIPQSFSWIDRELLHQRILPALSHEELLLYFFLVLVAGPEGTSFWSHQRIGKILKLTEDQVLEALRGLMKKDLVAFRYPIFQVLSLPNSNALEGEGGRR
jgi:hypothetical protein